ncbi:MAG: FAD-dependent oxidoreductase [Patescibacteria group bacterium]
MYTKNIGILFIGLSLITGLLLIEPKSNAISNRNFVGTNVECDVIVNGGSLAGYFAAYTAAKESKKTCLIEPTNWVGGQLTASGVPAIDWQWNSNINPSTSTANDGVNGNEPHKLRENNNFLFFDMIGSTTPKGKCWVSRDCFLSSTEITKLNSNISSLSNLRVFYNSVVKNVTRTNTGTKKDSSNNAVFNVDRIDNVGIIQRTAINGSGYDKRLSSDINDWYSEANSTRFNKTKFVLKGIGTKSPVVVDTSENGEIMTLANAAYLQGTEKFDGSVETANDQCGQSTTFTFNMKYNSGNVAENGPAKTSFDYNTSTFNHGNTGTWDRTWNYRRLAGIGNPYTPSLAVGDVSLMNWKSQGNNGNDYDSKYLFSSKANVTTSLSDWKGGYNLDALKGAEDKSYSFYYWMKDTMPSGYNKSWMNLDNASMGTTTGLYKYPYIRDTRRSVGIDNYVLKTSELLSQKPTGQRFKDRIATINYGFDIHPIVGCDFSNDSVVSNFNLPSYTEPYPFYVPLRALTNKSINNLVVGGKNIAQSFKVSAANRLQPSEANTGAAAGVFAAYLATNNLNTYSVLESSSYNTVHVPNIQTSVKKYQGIDWKFSTATYPSSSEYLKNVKFNVFCPVNTSFDSYEGFCTDSTNAYGPFSQVMINACLAKAIGLSCTSPVTVQSNDGRPMNVLIYSKKLARELRSTGECMIGLVRDTTKPDYCVETINGVKNVYGPFTKSQVDKCFTQLGGGTACYNNRWNYNFTQSIL